MEEVLQLYSQQLRARAEQPRSEEESRHDELRRKWRGWVRLARHRNAVNKSMGRCARTCKGSKNF